MLIAVVATIPGDTDGRQASYDAYKEVADNPPAQTGDPCKDQRNRIKWKEQERDMRQAWDDKYSPGLHAGHIRQLERDIRKLKKRYENSWDCHDKKPCT